MNVIPTAAGRKINTYPTQQNPNFGRAIIVKSKDSKLLEMLEHLDFFVWSVKKSRYTYKGNAALDTYKSKGNESAVFEGILADGAEANTLRRFTGLIKKAFYKAKDVEYDKLARREAKFLNKIKQKANKAGDVVEIKSEDDLLKLPMLQKDRAQIEDCLKETFPDDEVEPVVSLI